MFWLPIIWIALTIIAVVSRALQPKQQKRGPGELQSPMCEQGHPIAYVAGCAKIRGANVVWKGAPRAKPKNKGMMYDYYCRMMLAICQGPVDRCRRIWFQQETLPTTTVVRSGSVGAQVVHNAAGNVSAVSTYLSFPYPEGAQSQVGNQDAHLGTTIIKGVDFHVYTKMVSSTIDPSYKWVSIHPSIGDTCVIDGSFRMFIGAWDPPVNSLERASKVFRVKADNTEKGLKVDGNVRFYSGANGLFPDPYLHLYAYNKDAANWLGANKVSPTYEGLCYAMLVGSDENEYEGLAPTAGDFYWGESPNIPEISFEIERIPDPLGLGAAASPTFTIAPAYDGGSYTCRDANPANILYEWLTSKSMGIGVTLLDIDTPAFRDAGRILSRESVGITMVLDKQVSFDEAAKEILMVTDGVLYEDPATGLWTFRLIREPISAATAAAWGLETDFYSRTDWPVFDEDDFDGETEFTRGSWGDVANQIKIQYMDRKEGYAQRVIDVQDVANFIAMDGEVVTTQNTYNSITNRDLAIRIGYRDLRTLGTPRAKLKDEICARGWKLRPGDCFVMNRPAIGVTNMRMRVLTIRYGTLENRRVAVECIEDVFGMPDTVYSEPGTGWTDPTTIPPEEPAAVRAWELAYNVTGDGPRVGFAALVARGDERTTGAILWAMIGGRLEQIGPIDYTPTALLTPNLVIEERTASIQLQGVVDTWNVLGDAEGGKNLALVDNELIAYDSIGRNEDGTIYLSGCLRGVLDTIPRAHSTGARVWLIRNQDPVQGQIQTADHEELFAIQATSAGGQTDIIGANLYGGTTDSRELRPFVPGKFRVNGAATLEDSVADQIVTGDVAVAWETRNRLTQAPGVVAQDADGIAAESGQLSRLRLRGALDDLFPLVDAAGSPISSPYTIGPTGSLPANWATVQATRYLAPAGGLQDWAAVALATPAVGTWYIVLDLLAGTITQQSTAPTGTYQVKLYTVVVTTSGSNRVATITDNRTAWAASGEVGTVVTTDLLAGTCTADSASLAPSGLGPLRVALTAERDGLDSMEDRESGDVFWAGWGMSWGLHWGGHP